MKTRKDKYTKEQIEYLREIAPNKTNKEITEIFNKKFHASRTVEAIITIKNRYGIYSYTRVYTREQLKYLDKIKHNRSHKEITEMFNKQFKDDRTISSIKSIMQENGIKLSSDGRFKKGNVPANFKPVGSERLDSKDGYTLIKVQNQGSWQQRWRHKHVVLWEKHNGPVPEDHVIIFLDGDKTNITLDNLALASRLQLLILNRNDLIKKDIELTKAGLKTAELYSKIYEV